MSCLKKAGFEALKFKYLCKGVAKFTKMSPFRNPIITGFQIR